MQNQKKKFRPRGLEAKVEDGGFLSKMRKTKEINFFRHFFHEMNSNLYVRDFHKMALMFHKPNSQLELVRPMQ